MSEEETNEQDEQPAAWNDPDDDNLRVSLEKKYRLKKLKTEDDEVSISGKEYEQRLRDQFEKLQGKANWAKKMEEDNESEDEDAVKILRKAGKLLKYSGHSLAASEIKITKKPNANHTDEAKCALKVVQFHPNSEILMTAGIDKTLRLYHIDGEENTKMASYHMEKWPITSACFINNGDQILMTGTKSEIRCYDMATAEVTRLPTFKKESQVWGVVAGPETTSLQSATMFAVAAPKGLVLLGDMRSKQFIRSVKMSSACTGIAFHHGRDVLFTSDREGMLYEWDVRNGRCLGKVQLDTQHISTIAISPCAPYVIACSNPSGAVDMFAVDEPLIPNQKPFKSMMNLVTNPTTLAFHPRGELFVAASFDKKDHLKLWHRPTYKCYSNWPVHNSNLGYVGAVGFAAKGGLMAIANDKGKVLLRNIEHYI